jgi:DNA-binding GntR family transcriptional regulator
VQVVEPEISQPSRQSMADAAHAAIKRAIIRCELTPGQVVTEGELAARYGVGKAAVRLAFNRLQQDGLVQSLGRQGYRIAPITLDMVEDLFTVRLILESAAVRLAAAKITPSELAYLTELNEARYQPGDIESVDAFLRINTAFHTSIARSSGSPRLAELVGNLHLDLERVMHFGHLLYDIGHLAHNEHQELIEALAAGDADQAERAIVSEVRDAQQGILVALMSSPSLRQINLAAP